MKTNTYSSVLGANAADHGITYSSSYRLSDTIDGCNITDVRIQQVEEVKRNFEDLIQMLIYKGIIKDKEEFKEYQDAIRVSEKLAESGKNGKV
jgi:hypothetical protein